MEEKVREMNRKEKGESRVLGKSFPTKAPGVGSPFLRFCQVIHELQPAYSLSPYYFGIGLLRHRQNRRPCRAFGLLLRLHGAHQHGRGYGADWNGA
jgi:hypothetical protein